MNYELLVSLYFGEGSNADLTSPQSRRLLHVATPLEQRISTAVSQGLDVVLTGNPGDGKSHIARTLSERGLLRDAVLLLDLSAKPTREALRQWAGLKGKQGFVMCANEGPLRELISEARSDEQLQLVAAELSDQIGRLMVADPTELPRVPKKVMLIDLADRNVLDVGVVSAAIERVCREEFLPSLRDRSIETSAGRNMVLLQQEEPRRRLARLLSVAGRRRGEHVTFRQLWAAIALAVTGGKALGTLQVELSTADSYLGLAPLDYLTSRRARGLLAEGVRSYADVVEIPSPDLDDALWHTSTLPSGEWFLERPHVDDSPQRLWEQGERIKAMKTFCSLKRAVAIGHSSGEAVIRALETSTASPIGVRAQELRQRIVLGLKRMYVAAADERTAPMWLSAGVPLWVNVSFQDRPISERPHVAVTAVDHEEFEVLHPCRAPWLDAALGPSPDFAWLRHVPSRERLLVTPEVLAALDRASATAGPVDVPPAVERFLSRIAGWTEREGADDILGEEDVAVLERPRGALVATAKVRIRSGRASYA